MATRKYIVTLSSPLFAHFVTGNQAKQLPRVGQNGVSLCYVYFPKDGPHYLLVHYAQDPCCFHYRHIPKYCQSLDNYLNYFFI
jgi:hypothetical protein